MEIKAVRVLAARPRANHERQCYRKSKHSILMICAVSSDCMNLDEPHPMLEFVGLCGTLWLAGLNGILTEHRSLPPLREGSRHSVKS